MPKVVKSFFAFTLFSVMVLLGTQARAEDGTKLVVPGGQSIGVSLNFSGAFVDQLGEIEASDGDSVSPAREAGIVHGDIITAVNGTKTETVSRFSEILNSCESSDVTLTVRGKDNEFREVSLTPVRDASDDKLKIGAWMMDAASGVGTVTYFDPQTNEFAAVGHSINDSLPDSAEDGLSGDIYKADVVGVRRGESGTPGELIGVYSDNKLKIGEISASGSHGIVGTVSNPENLISVRGPIPLGGAGDAVLGEAKICSNIEGNKIEEFTINITEINPEDPDDKDIIFEVTDENLIKRTGGIVRGMSGSPIIQNNKIIGSVTHVLINKPTLGYGIFTDEIQK